MALMLVVSCFGNLGAVLAYRMLNRQADKAFIANAINNHAARTYNDINAGQWFFYDVYAASWGHNYTIKNGVEKWTGLNGKAFTIR